MCSSQKFVSKLGQVSRQLQQQSIYKPPLQQDQTPVLAKYVSSAQVLTCPEADTCLKFFRRPESHQSNGRITIYLRPVLVFRYLPRLPARTVICSNVTQIIELNVQYSKSVLKFTLKRSASSNQAVTTLSRKIPHVNIQH